MPLSGVERKRRHDYRQHILDTLGYGNTMKESGYDPDTIEDGRNDAAWVADCLRVLGQWVASINDYHGRRQWITPGQQEKDKRGEVGFTG